MFRLPYRDWPKYEAFGGYKLVPKLLGKGC
ncbi:hypothetical protein SBA6_100033 [Candidatus Sulfopaludibacter sp. SbA6]|nr:hypothetical protein SBA6_100033 [Candidatus Sulfopaludibacter sp. SbA6]